MRNQIGKNVIRMHSKGVNADIGKHKFDISPEGIHEFTELGDSATNWKAVENIVKTNEYVYIHIRPSSAAIIPKRVFSNESAFDQFAQDIKRIFEASKISG